MGDRGDNSEPWLCDPYNKTATGYLGDRRKTMFDNHLLLRTGPGQQRKLCCIPKDMPKNLTHGTNYRDDFTVGHALNGWNGVCKEHGHDYNLSNLLPPVKFKKEPDYMAMNRAAVSSGMANVYQNTDFRKNHLILKEIPKREVKPLPLEVDNEVVFGIATNAPSKINEVLTNKFQEDWIRKMPCAKTEVFTAKDIDYTKVYENRACQLRAFMPKTGIPEPLWKMPRFTKKAKPHLSTFRNLKDEQASYEHNKLEKIGHEGVNGGGIATKAKFYMDYQHCPKICAPRESCYYD